MVSGSLSKHCVLSLPKGLIKHIGFKSHSFTAVAFKVRKVAFSLSGMPPFEDSQPIPLALIFELHLTENESPNLTTTLGGLISRQEELTCFPRSNTQSTNSGHVQISVLPSIIQHCFG